MPGYHKYVFDPSKRKFIGNFEKMYDAEDREGFDSWYERDMRPLRKTLSFAVLDAYSFNHVLDLGCGKGTFTHLLKKTNNYVMGIDGSKSAIRKARESYPDVDFRCLKAERLASLETDFDLIVVMGLFAYIRNWPCVLAAAAQKTKWFYVAEYIPSNPIGFVKSADHLIREVSKYFVIKTKILLNDDHCLLMGEVKGMNSEAK